MANYAWLTDVADKAYNRMRDLRPERNLQRNRELIARARQEAAEQADAEYQALLEQDRQAQAAPAVPLLTVPSTSAQPVSSASPRGTAKTTWDDYAARRLKANSDLDARAARGEDVGAEFEKTMAQFEAEKANLTKHVGGAPEGSLEWLRENRERPSGKTGSSSVSGGTSSSSSIAGAGEGIRGVAEGYLSEQLTRGPQDTRRDEIYLRNLGKSRDQVLPQLWGTEGAGGIEEEIKSVRDGLSGKDATKLEIARMNNAAKVATSYKAGEASSARAKLASDALDLKRELGRRALDYKGVALDLEARKEFGRMLRSARDNATRNRDIIYDYMASGGGFMRDAATGQTISTQQAAAQADAQVAKLENLLAPATEGMFRTGDDWLKAIEYAGDAAVDPQFERTRVLEGEPVSPLMGSAYRAVGIEPPAQAVKNPGSVPLALTAPPPMTMPPIATEGLRFTAKSGSSRDNAPPRRRKKSVPPLNPGEVVVKDMGDYVWVKDRSGNRRKVVKK